MGNLRPQSFHLTNQHGHLHANALGYEFNGQQDDAIELPSTWGGPHWQACTVEAWIRPNANTGDFQAIVSPADTSFIHFQVHHEGTGNCSVYTDQGAVLLPVIPVEPLDQWRHVAIIAESGASRLLIDGDQYGPTNTKTFHYITPTHALFIGKGYQGGRHFRGAVGNVHIWQMARQHHLVHRDLYRFLVDKPVMQTPEPATTVGFKSHHDTYMSAQPDGTITCDRNWLRGWEIFTVEDAGNGKVGLKSFHGKYLSAQPDGSLQVNRDWLMDWEKFSLEEQDGKVGLKGHHGKYVSAQPDGTITCDRDWLREWELFDRQPA